MTNQPIRCRLCPEEEGFAASATCPRCKANFCIGHAPVSGTRCLDCELVYHERKQVLQPFFTAAIVLSAAGFLYLWGAEVGNGTGVPAFSTATSKGGRELDFLMMAASAVLTGGLICRAIRYVHRRRFLSQGAS